MKYFTATICLMTIPFLFSQAAPGARPQLRAAQCLPSSEFSLSGLTLGQSEAAARRILGKPKRITRKRDEDDGGFLTVTVLHYRQLKVEIARGVVDRLYADLPGARTPAGVGPGMKIGDVGKALGKEMKALDGRRYSYKSCDESAPAYFVMEFNRGMVLSSLDISADRP